LTIVTFERMLLLIQLIGRGKEEGVEAAAGEKGSYIRRRSRC
jgi:hypothetical protein